MKNYLKILLLLFALLLILFLTLQTPEQTWSLTRAVQSFLLRLFPDGRAPAWITDGQQLRHAAHIPEYFLLGLALCSVLKDRKHGLLLAVFFGVLIGLADETLKIFLPTREFSLPDLAFDALGVSLAAVLFMILSLCQKKTTRPSATRAETAER